MIPNINQPYRDDVVSLMVPMRTNICEAHRIYIVPLAVFLLSQCVSVVSVESDPGWTLLKAHVL